MMSEIGGIKSFLMIINSFLSITIIIFPELDEGVVIRRFKALYHILFFF